LRELVFDLEVSEARKRAILENSPDAIITMDHLGRVIEVNPAAERILGFEIEKLIGNDLIDLVIPEAERETARALLAVLNHRFELAVIRQDGGRLLMEGLVSPIFKGKRPVFTAFLKDITRRKQAEEEWRRSVEELSRSNEELERFAYVASHDLQEPLRMVTSYMRLLDQRYKGKLDENADTYLRFATDGAARMRQLILDLLEYSRVQRGIDELDLVDCTSAARDALAALRLSIEECAAKVEIGTLPRILGNNAQIRQLFQNLVGNALKFRRESAPEIKITAEQQEGEWLVRVSDNGIGLDMANSERIFEAFQRLHSRTEYPGTGIGLAICKRIVEVHGGRIWVDSPPGKDTVFSFTFPAPEKTKGSAIAIPAAAFQNPLVSFCRETRQKLS